MLALVHFIAIAWLAIQSLISPTGRQEGQNFIFSNLANFYFLNSMTDRDKATTFKFYRIFSGLVYIVLLFDMNLYLWSITKSFRYRVFLFILWVLS